VLTPPVFEEKGETYCKSSAEGSSWKCFRVQSDGSGMLHVVLQVSRLILGLACVALKQRVNDVKRAASVVNDVKQAASGVNAVKRAAQAEAVLEAQTKVVEAVQKVVKAEAKV
jgi:hypothetical protein